MTHALSFFFLFVCFPFMIYNSFIIQDACVITILTLRNIILLSTQISVQKIDKYISPNFVYCTLYFTFVHHLIGVHQNKRVNCVCTCLRIWVCFISRQTKNSTVLCTCIQLTFFPNCSCLEQLDCNIVICIVYAFI